MIVMRIEDTRHTAYRQGAWSFELGYQDVCEVKFVI